jgi:RNA polymerase sigma factor (sigma-70 family)
MHDLRLELRARNNVLWHAIFDLYPSVVEFCRVHGFVQGVVGGYLNLTRSPYFHAKSRIGCDWWNISDERGRVLTPSAERLCEITGIGRDELWPMVLYSGLIAPRRVAEVAATSFVSLSSARHVALPATQEDAMINDERRQMVEAVLATLTPRQARIIRSHFGFDSGELTLEEIASQERVSKGRVGAIELQALEKLKRGSRRKRLRELVDTHV